MSRPHDAVGAGGKRTQVQVGALVVGVAFLLVGVLGFVPGVTQSYETMRFASHHSDAQILGLFQVSVLHNLVHLVFGVAGVLLARSTRTAINYLRIGGLIYVVFFLYGIEVPQMSAANFLPMDDADDGLHAVLGFGMIALAIVLSRDSGRTSDTQPEP